MPGFHRVLARSGWLAAPLLIAAAMAPAGPATPEPPSDTAVTAADTSRLVAIAEAAGRAREVTVHSAAMGADLRLTVLPAHDPSAPAPVLYLLNGAAGGSAGSTWTDQTDVAEFLADQQVTVVIPTGGAGSYFTDWHADDPELGRQRWATFLTRELPPIMNATFHGTGANAIAGISMAATSVLQLAVTAPGLYRAVGSYSGCVRTSDPSGQAMVTAVVSRWGGNPVNMWGPFTDPTWAANDAYLHADKLRGLALYVSTGTGMPGSLDGLDDTGGDTGKLAGQLTNGAILEAVIDRCTHQLRDRLRELDIPATFDFRRTGTHSWGYWQQDLHNSWPLIRDALAR
ncbi:alpha/beta hydrolase [Nocardia arizonensis]|uniref:alpha/beta hydrolase n=1 Tax=Nocardia arizonensis TaxID=1141647 RepID=UPI0006CF98A7|nr:alpha/beta hydrolase family protein [Nocardia arizonensis]